jgi:hypothetical protein
MKHTNSSLESGVQKPFLVHFVCLVFFRITTRFLVAESIQHGGFDSRFPLRHNIAECTVVFLICLCSLFLSTDCFAQQTTDEGVFPAMMQQPAQECAEKVPPGDLFLNINPVQAPICILQVFSEKLGQRGVHVSTGGGSIPLEMDIDVREMNSSTALCGISSYLRHSSMRMGVIVRNKQSGVVLWSKEYPLTLTDTLSGVPEYRERNHLIPEKESWWESLATPVLLSAAALVIVVLLFTIRGS